MRLSLKKVVFFCLVGSFCCMSGHAAADPLSLRGTQSDSAPDSKVETRVEGRLDGGAARNLVTRTPIVPKEIKRDAAGGIVRVVIDSSRFHLGIDLVSAGVWRLDSGIEGAHLAGNLTVVGEGIYIFAGLADGVVCRIRAVVVPYGIEMLDLDSGAVARYTLEELSNYAVNGLPSGANLSSSVDEQSAKMLLVGGELEGVKGSAFMSVVGVGVVSGTVPLAPPTASPS